MLVGNNKTIAVIDIGGTKIASSIAKVHRNGSVKILGVGNVASEGLRNGLIQDVKLLRSAIASSLHEAEHKSSKMIDNIVINVSHPLMKSSTIKIVSKFNGKQILSNDLKRIINLALSKVDLDKYEILYNTALNYDLDEMLGIKDPEFMFVNSLTSYINVITVPLKFLINLSSCLLGCQLKISDFIISSYASAMVCATDQEREKGCIIADIGGNMLDYIVIKDCKILASGVIPLGGKIITQDIVNYFAIDFVEAEKIKILYGKLCDFYLDENNIISVNTTNIQGENNITEISNSLLNKVIKSRFKEIISIFIKKIYEKHLDKDCIERFIFTGGSSQFVGLEHFIKQEFNLSARKGLPINFASVSDIDLDASFSTMYGMIKCSISKNSQVPIKKHHSIKKAISWLKQNF